MLTRRSAIKGALASAAALLVVPLAKLFPQFQTGGMVPPKPYGGISAWDIHSATDALRAQPAPQYIILDPYPDTEVGYQEWLQREAGQEYAKFFDRQVMESIDADD